jgi:hypothetical protein
MYGGRDRDDGSCRWGHFSLRYGWSTWGRNGDDRGFGSSSSRRFWHCRLGSRWGRDYPRRRSWVRLLDGCRSRGWGSRLLRLILNGSRIDAAFNRLVHLMEPIHRRVWFEDGDGNDGGGFFENGLMVRVARHRYFLSRWISVDTRFTILALFILAIAHCFFLEEPENVI